MEIVLSDEDKSDIFSETWNDDNFACLFEGSWLNDKVTYSVHKI